MGAMVLREQLLALVEEISTRTELKEPGSFRIRAYQRLAEVLEGLPETAFTSPEALQQALHGQKGIGEGLLSLVGELAEKGDASVLQQLRQEVPNGLLELRRLRGLGPKRIHELWTKLHITSVDALEQALLRGKLATLPGWGEALIGRLSEQITFYRQNRNKLLYAEALALWREATAALVQAGLHPMPLGALRRAWPELSLPIEGALSAEKLSHSQALGWQATEEKALIHPDFSGIKLYLWPDSEIPYRLAAEGFTETLPLVGAEVGAVRTEAEVFTRLGLPYILPAWRDWPDIVELARHAKLPEPLTAAHIRGTVHVHTTYSDGVHDLAAMAEAARARGWKWLGIADHSQRAAYAKGLSPERLREQWAEIDHLNAHYAGEFYLLKGVEADILPDGSLDYDETVWPDLDFIVASVHEKLAMSRTEATHRLLKALSNPHVSVLGHWTGRLLRNRPGYPIDEEKILDFCAERGIAIEFNANPYRMEIDWRWVRRAAEKGVRIILTTDAHSVQELSYWEQGLQVLQKGLLPPALLLNSSELPPFPLKR